MYKQTTKEIIMIEPIQFKYNAETAVNNKYQHADSKKSEKIQERALKEFNGLVDKLKARGVKVNILKDMLMPETPDSIFPNNWFSTHEGGSLVIFPMFAKNRREEVTKFRGQVTKIMNKLEAVQGKEFKIHDYLSYIEEEKFLEGTGAMVIDRKNRIAYCALSPRADKDLFIKFCEDTNHKPVFFTALQDGIQIYHTNVMMGIGEENAIVCMESILEEDRDRVRNELVSSGKKIIEITLDQVKKFLGNTLELKGKDEKNFIVMSDTAYYSLTEEQKGEIMKKTEIVHANIETIEYYGGGSVRCMLAEVFI